MSQEDTASDSRQEKVSVHVLESTAALRPRGLSMLKDDKPSNLRGCLHTWQLRRQGDMFILACSWCDTATKAKALPSIFQHVLDVVSKLNPVYCANEPAGKRWKVSDADLRAAVSLLNLPSQSRSERAWAWDVYATLHILLSLKNGAARGNLVVKSKALTKLIVVSMYPDRLRQMPLSSRKRYSFVIDVINKLPARLSAKAFFSATKPV